MARIGVNGMSIAPGKRYGFLWLKKRDARFIHNHCNEEIDIMTTQCSHCGKKASTQALHCTAVRSMYNEIG